jgi:glutathione S-transferase
MKLFYFPGACSLGIHILLEEIGAPYEAQSVDLMSGEQYRPEFVAINPKSKVPVLVLDDGAVLTEWPAIATYLGVTNMGAGLLPMDALLIARIMEAVTHINATMHMQGFARVLFPANFAANPDEKDAVQEKGRQIMAKGFDLLAASWGDNEYVAGAFSLADAALFYITFWWKRFVKLALPPAIEAHYTRMLARPAVQRAMTAENLN